jgi:hypothetical protein
MTENEKKTLLNCTTKEFLTTINSLRHDIAKFFEQTKLDEIIYKTIDIPEDMPEKERGELLVKKYNERMDKVIETCFCAENIDGTFELLAKMSFGTVEEIEKLGDIEVVALLMKFMTNSRTMNFFIMQRSMAAQSSAS